MKLQRIVNANSRQTSVPVAKGSTVWFDFKVDQAEFECEGSDLAINFADGGKTTLEGFFGVKEAAGLPRVLLSDGGEFDATNFMREIEQGVDISTEAGETSPADSGGLGGYVDASSPQMEALSQPGGASSQLVGSVEVLGALEEPGEGDALYPDGLVAPGQSVWTPFSIDGGLGGGSGNEAFLPLVPPESDARISYEARAVLYADGSSPLSGQQVAAELLNHDGTHATPGQNPSLVQLAGDGDPGDPYITWSYNAQGQLVFSLTQAGHDYLAALGSGDRQYIETIFEVAHGSESYFMQVVVPANGSFDAQGAALAGTEYGVATPASGLIHGEWHQGAALDGALVKGADFSGDFYFSGDVENSFIQTGYAVAGSGPGTVRIGGTFGADGQGVGSLVTSGAGSYVIFGEDASGNLADFGASCVDHSTLNVEAQGSGASVAVKASINGLQSGSGGESKIAADTVSVDVSAQYSARGMYVFDSDVNLPSRAYGHNTVAAKNVTVSACSAEGSAYGMYAQWGTNTVRGLDGHALEFELSANAAALGGYAYGMFAEGPSLGGYTVKNQILAGEDGAVVVTISADARNADRAIAMWASGNGAINYIEGGDAADEVNILGDIHAEGMGSNLIDLGAGDDLLTLYGKVDFGSLTIVAGDGHDTLVLGAASAADFEEYYKDWLDPVFGSNKFGDMSFEVITVHLDGGNINNINGLDWLLDRIDAYNQSASNPVELNLTFDGELAGQSLTLGAADDCLRLGVESYGNVLDGGIGEDVLHIDCSGNMSEVENFFSVNTVNNFEKLVLDMTNGQEDTLYLDDLISTVSAIGGGFSQSLHIKADSTDIISAGTSGSWAESGNTVELGGVTYTGWVNNDSNELVFIEQGLIIL